MVGITLQDGGVLRVPEWVVYKTTQAKPKYLLRVQEEASEPAQHV